MRKKSPCWLWECQWYYAPCSSQKEREQREEQAAFWVAEYLKHSPRKGKGMLIIVIQCTASPLQNVTNAYINSVYIPLSQKRQWFALKPWRSWLFICLCNSSFLLSRFFKPSPDHYRFSLTVLSFCEHAVLEWPSSLLSHSGAGCPASPFSPYSGSHLWNRSVTKAPPTCWPLLEAKLMYFFF